MAKEKNSFHSGAPGSICTSGSETNSNKTRLQLNTVGVFALATWIQRLRHKCVSHERLADCGNQISGELGLDDVCGSPGSECRRNIGPVFMEGQKYNFGSTIGILQPFRGLQPNQNRHGNVGDMGEDSDALAFLPVTMNGDGKTQIVQLRTNNGRLGLIVYSPQTDGSYKASFGSADMDEGSGALAFLPVTMNGDGKTQIAQLWAG